MTIITLTILGEDIKTSEYINYKDCAITKALHRAGFPNYFDEGCDISDDKNNVIVSNNNQSYNDLSNKVQDMYRQFRESDKDEEIHIEDYTHVLEF